MLQLVLGRAGSGKTEYVFSSIKKLIENGEKNILLITPEQFSFIAERRLLEELKEDKVNLVESMSFTRLSNEISRLYGGDRLPVLSKSSKAVIMKYAIDAVQDELSLFNKNISSSFINSIISIYDEMKSCRVTLDDIFEAEENTDKKILKEKLHDIGLIIGMYDAMIKDKYYDSANELTRLYHKLTELTYFKNRTVFIDGFSGFVAQEYKIIEVILKQAKEVYVTFCTDAYKNLDKYYLFSYVNENIQRLKDVAEDKGVTVNEPIILEKTHRFENCELEAIEKGAFYSFKESLDTVPKSVEIYRANNIYDECDNAALKISKLLRKGYKAGDITVIVRDLDKYEKELSFAFSKYNIPLFDDERRSISTEPLIMFVNFLLRTLIYSYSSEDIFSLLKTGLTALDDDDISELENYVYLWSISGSKWKNDFTESTKGFSESISNNDQKRIDKINKTRNYIIANLEKFKKRCRKASALEIAKAVYFALIDFSVDEQLKGLALSLDENGKSALAIEQERIWDRLMEILDELAMVGESKGISVKDFYSLFNLMLSNVDMGVIPVGVDNVQLGSADRIRCNNPSVVFILGANEGEFPRTVTSAGLLSESDRIALLKNNFKLYSYGDTLNAQEKYFAYMAMTSARNKLYVSYIGSVNFDNESVIVREIVDVYPKIEINDINKDIRLDYIESKASAFELLASNYKSNNVLISSLNEYFTQDSEYSARLSALRRVDNNDNSLIKDKNTAIGLFGKNMYLSASRIEDYYNCSFRYFCKFGLNARPRTRAKMDPMQTGTVIHYVLEHILKEKGKSGLLSLTSPEIKLLVTNYLEHYLMNMMGDSDQFTARFKYQFMRLSRMLISVVERLKAEFEQSDFVPAAFELSIGNGDAGESVKSKVLSLSDGGTIEIKGAIDRVDIYEENGVKYVRVVDYKSGNKKFSLSDILYGLNLQMFIYLFNLCDSKSEFSGVSSGVLYMHSARKLYSIDRSKNTEKQLMTEDNKLYKMKGVVLNDDENEIARHMEHNLEGKFIPVKYSKGKDALTGDILTLSELGSVAKKIESLVIQMGDSLHKGLISENPVSGQNHDKTCEFCDYRCVCMNKKEITLRETETLNNSDVINKIVEETANA